MRRHDSSCGVGRGAHLSSALRLSMRKYSRLPRAATGRYTSRAELQGRQAGRTQVRGAGGA